MKNMAESLKFYQDIVGLTVDRRFKAGPDTEIAFLGDGETKIELICDANRLEINIGSAISWGFTVDSVEAMMRVIQAKGLAIHDGPFQPNPQVRFFYVLDPNGLRIQFVENIEA